MTLKTIKENRKEIAKIITTKIVKMEMLRKSIQKEEVEKAYMLAGLVMNWCLTTRKKTIWRSDILEELGRYNDSEEINYKGFLLFPMGLIEKELDNMTKLFKRNKGG